MNYNLPMRSILVVLVACDGGSSTANPDGNIDPTPHELRGFDGAVRLVDGGYLNATLGSPLQPGTVSASISGAFFDPASTNVGTCTDKAAGDHCVVTLQCTLGTSFGTRPIISRLKSSTISGRRCFHQISAVVTFSPFFNTSGSGRSGTGLAFSGS